MEYQEKRTARRRSCFGDFRWILVQWLGVAPALCLVFDSGGSEVDTSDDESFDGVPLVAIAFNIAKGQQIKSKH